MNFNNECVPMNPQQLFENLMSQNYKPLECESEKDKIL